MSEPEKKAAEVMRALSRAEIHKIAEERVSEISKEFAAGFELLEDYPKSATFFGSTRSAEDDPYYQDARKLSSRIVKELDYSIVSGGGPGIMEAADRGAYDVRGNSIGLLINLPNGQPTNPYLKKSISFYYFFSRKVMLAFGAEVYIFYPGGYGTLDEFFELITLIQTKKVLGTPIICVGSVYWNKLKSFIEEELSARGFIDKTDLDLFTITDNHDEIIEIIKKAPIRENIPLRSSEIKPEL